MSYRSAHPYYVQKLIIFFKDISENVTQLYLLTKYIFNYDQNSLPITENFCVIKDANFISRVSN